MSEITLKTLRAKGACPAALSEFERRFGERVAVTEAVAESVATVFDWDWAAAEFLSNSAWVEYERVCDQAQSEYERVRSQAWVEYKRICARTFARVYAEAAQSKAEGRGS